MSREKETLPGRRIFVVAACASSIIPVAVVVMFLAGAVILGQYKRQDSWLFGVFLLACMVGFLSGAVSFVGIRWNHWLLIVPAAILGLLLNVVVGFVALFIFGLSGLAG
jgi:hypothetical protein